MRPQLFLRFPKFDNQLAQGSTDLLLSFSRLPLYLFSTARIDAPVDKPDVSLDVLWRQHRETIVKHYVVRAGVTDWDAEDYGAALT